MPRAKKIQPPIYLVHYDDETRQIIAVTNTKSKKYKHSIEVTFDQYDKFMTGKWLMQEYIVSKDPEEILPIADQVYSFKNSAFEWIVDDVTDETDLIVTWNFPKGRWEFSVSKQCKDTIRKKGIFTNLSFFIMLETDYDFLIRTVTVPTADLLRYDDYKVDFNSNVEKKIDKLSITAKKIFNKYGLRIINE